MGEYVTCRLLVVHQLRGLMGLVRTGSQHTHQT